MSEEILKQKLADCVKENERLRKEKMELWKVNKELQMEISEMKERL